ncbi:response regulator transcription factor [Aquabacterium humicola]|uniref:response regulator transcription factor n=1 Tax=Aquabacterium humicola TaxID=3237377 RepID=UPI002543003C|nr:response regulator transcription factor [Rubrivivax pictus]
MICDPCDHLDVLVVDDEPEVGAFVQEYLARYNVRSFVATSAGQARVIARVEPPSVVLLDLIMPGETGLSLGRWLRSYSAQTRIVIMSAAGELVQLIAESEGIVDDCLLKPFAPAELLASIGTQLSKARLHGSPPPRTVGWAAVQAVPSRPPACGQGPRSQ